MRGERGTPGTHLPPGNPGPQLAADPVGECVCVCERARGSRRGARNAACWHLAPGSTPPHPTAPHTAGPLHPAPPPPCPRTPVACPQVRGRGLLNAIVVDPAAKVEAWDICLKLMREGLLTKPTHR